MIQTQLMDPVVLFTLRAILFLVHHMENEGFTDQGLPHNWLFLLVSRCRGMDFCALSEINNVMRGNTKTIASTGQDTVYSSLRFCSCDPLRECTLSAGRDDGKWSIPFDMDSPTTEQPLRFVFPIHCEPLMLQTILHQAWQLCITDR